MKSKFLLIPALLLGATALGGAAVALAHNNVAKGAKAEESAYAITDAMYEVAFLEQYDDNGTAVATENYSYANDKPLDVNSVGGFQYGIAGNSSTNLKKTNFTTSLYGGVNETLQWRFSGMNTKSKTNPNRLYVQLENNSSNWNICKPASFPQETSPDEYALGQLVTAAGKAKGASLVSTTAITNIQDFSFFWRSSYTTKVLICYQLDGETEWKVYTTLNMDESTEKIHGNYSGTRGWDTYGYTTFNSTETWANSELRGATARLAIVCTEAPTESGNLPISAILVNANNAAVRYLNALTYREGICSSEALYDLNKTVSDKRHNQDLFHLATERATGAFLANYTLQGSKTSDTNALSFYNHLVSSISGLGTTKVASSNFFMNMNNNANITIIVSISIAAAAVIGTGLFFGLRKRKHN